MSTINPISSFPQPAVSSGAGTTGMDKNAFLRLLTAQLKYQDPSNPLSSDQFMSQMAQFSALEQITNLAQTTESGLWASQVSQAVMTIGKQVSWTDPGSGENGQGTVSGVTMQDNKLTLKVGEALIPISWVHEVNQA